MTRRRIPDEEAMADALRAGYTPQDPRHPGTQQRWLGTCNTCGEFVAPFYGNVRQGHKACRACAKPARPASPARRARLTLEEAARHFKAAHLTPLDAYPGSVAKPWRSLCDTCGSVVAPRINSVIRTQAGCRRCGVTKALATRARNKARA